MGLFDDFFKEQVSKIPSPTSPPSRDDKSSDAGNIYETDEFGSKGKDSKDPGSRKKNGVVGNWYKQKPYAFQFGSASNNSLRTFYLPISPSNLNITTHFATNIISTMYGTVEEHSEQRYFDITISGTTGMSPKYYKEVEAQIKDSDTTKTIGRAGTPVKNRIGGQTGLGGFFERTLSLVENTLNQTSDLLGEDKTTTGIDLERTGYVAFHNFYKFLLVHKKLAANEKDMKGRKSVAINKKLRFINYKDNNQYDVAIQNFQLVRDSSNPMLYNYNIVMRAYNLRSANAKDVEKDVSNRAAELGLSGINNSSAFSKLSNKVRGAKNAAFSAIGAIRGFGS